MPPSPHPAFVRLALGELEALAGTGLTGLFALLHAAVARHAAGLLERGARGFVRRDERAGEAVADRARLAGDSAALGEHDDVDLLHVVAGDCDGLLQVVAERLGGDVLLDRDAVDSPNALAFNEIHAGGRRLAAASSGGDSFLSGHFLNSFP